MMTEQQRRNSSHYFTGRFIVKTQKENFPWHYIILGNKSNVNTHIHTLTHAYTHAIVNVVESVCDGVLLAYVAINICLWGKKAREIFFVSTSSW